MLRYAIAAVLLICASTAVGAPGTVSLNQLLDAKVEDLKGRSLGEVEEIIVDTRGAEALYLIAGSGEAARTLPFRALAAELPGGVLRIDMDLADKLARRESPEDPRFRRASKLIGQDIIKPGGGVIGRIRDLQIDMATGEVKRVEAQTGDGEFGFPPSVLAQGFYPPLTRWQARHPTPEAEGNFGYVRGEPSQERRSVQGAGAFGSHDEPASRAPEPDPRVRIDTEDHRFVREKAPSRDDNSAQEIPHSDQKLPDRAGVGSSSNAAIPSFSRSEQFVVLDVNGDGMLSLQEAMARVDVAAAFERGDRNSDGQLSQGEFVLLVLNPSNDDPARHVGQ